MPMLRSGSSGCTTANSRKESKMKVKVERKWPKSEYTIGRMYIDGEFLCNSLEDADRGLQQWWSLAEIQNAKVYGETAIPKGIYKVTMTYSPRFKRQMPQVMNVPGFTGVRIHSANKATQLEGCIALGFNTQPGMVTKSRMTCKKFEEMLIAAGGTCDLEIV